MKVIIIYYIYINPNRDWKCIINGQLNDLKTVDLLNNSLFIHICCENNKYILECINLISNFDFPFKLSTSFENQYEYPGIKLMYDVSQKNPDCILFYMHSKGMVFTNQFNRRSDCEKLFFRYTIKDYQKVLTIFKEQENINKIGLMQTEGKYIFCNFFWIRTNYLIGATPPVISDNRFDYEFYIGNCKKDLNDCYSLITGDNLMLNYDKISYYRDNLKISEEFKQVSSFFNLKNYTFYYGIDENKTNISSLIKKCIKNHILTIPSGDVNRANIFGDPLLNVYKNIFIKKFYKETTYTDISNIYIDLINDIVYQVDETSEDIKCLPEQKLKTIHSSLKIKHGNFNEEYPEQLMAVNYLIGNEKVLEIGGNIGRNTLVIARILNSSNLVTLECDKESYNQLNENKLLNGLNFFIENSALSAKKLIQKGWDTVPSDVLLDGYTSVNTITFQELKQKYQIDFDTLVLDCEGAFYYILNDFPEILNGINLIIMENDYHDISHKEYVNLVLKQQKFYVDYSQPGGWGPCVDFFYEVWKR